MSYKEVKSVKNNTSWFRNMVKVILVTKRLVTLQELSSRGQETIWNKVGEAGQQIVFRTRCSTEAGVGPLRGEVADLLVDIAEELNKKLSHVFTADESNISETDNYVSSEWSYH